MKRRKKVDPITLVGRRTLVEVCITWRFTRAHRKGVYGYEYKYFLSPLSLVLRRYPLRSVRFGLKQRDPWESERANLKLTGTINYVAIPVGQEHPNWKRRETYYYSYFPDKYRTDCEVEE